MQFTVFHDVVFSLSGSLDASPGCPPLGKGGNSFVGYPIFSIKIIPPNYSPPFQGGDRLTKRPASQSGAVACAMAYQALSSHLYIHPILPFSEKNLIFKYIFSPPIATLGAENGKGYTGNMVDLTIIIVSLLMSFFFFGA